MNKRMNKKSYLLLIFILIITILSCIMILFKNEVFAYVSNQFSINEIIEVGDKIYVQHDENNNDIYDLVKQGDTTVVYEVIFVNFTANKAWSTKGEYVNVTSTIAHGATAPNDYIKVSSGEEYFVKLYGVGYISSDLSYAPILFLNDNNEVVDTALVNTLSKSKSGVTVKVPEGATKMHITMYNNQNFTLQKVHNVSSQEFDGLTKNVNKETITTKVETNYQNYLQDKVVYKELDKAYISFVNDDTRNTIGDFADLFIEKNIPLCLATVPELLIENTKNSKETRLEVIRRVEANGGEILAHNGGVLTESNYTNYNTLYSFFVRSKQIFNYYNLDVNGIILAGGTGLVSNNSQTEKWASSFYSYSDLYGVETTNELAMDSVYYHRRGGLSNYNNDFDKIKQVIDKAIVNKEWLVFYWHDENEVTTETLTKILDYINSKNKEEIEAVTYRTMYKNYAIKESNLIKQKTTYYISESGTSLNGTSENDPMSLETANQKKYKSGDTILFKKSDTFYGTFNPNIITVDDNITKISSYGEGELPTISAYKLVTKDSAWELYSNGIYRINLANLDNFSGLKETNTNSNNIGFIEDDNGNKYYNRKNNLTELTNEYDFYCDGTHLYFKINQNPYTKLGNLKLAPKTNLMILKSNMEIDGISFEGTGAHGLTNNGSSIIQNVIIKNSIIENIGGSILKDTTRYGNGIEFYGIDAKNIEIKDNIIRNVYDVAFTIQGTQGSGNNIDVHNNVFVNNSQDSEIWESGTATGVTNYEFHDNISINQGRGWGYEARTDKYVAAHILFWGYLIENTDIKFYNNTVYNPRRLYFVEQTHGTNIFFKETNKIKSDNNNYLLATDSKIFREMGNYYNKDSFIAEYQKDKNSTFTLIEESSYIKQVADNSNNIKLIRALINPEVQEITLEGLTTDIELIQNKETLNYNNLTVKIKYTNGQTDSIKVTDDMISNIDYSVIGKQLVTVTYMEKTVSFEINIVKDENNKETESSKENNNKEDINDTANNDNNNQIEKEETLVTAEVTTTNYSITSSQVVNSNNNNNSNNKTNEISSNNEIEEEKEIEKNKYTNSNTNEKQADSVTINNLASDSNKDYDFGKVIMLILIIIVGIVIIIL